MLLAFATVYLVWGTTYFVVGEVVHAWPPLLMTAGRFAVAGTILYLWRRANGVPAPTLRHWLAASWVGALLLLGGYGLTAWAQQRVSSGLTALLVSVTPLIMVVVEWMRPGGHRPSLPVLMGIGLGLAGMVLLVGPARLEAARNADLISTLACAGAALCWATGSVLGRHAGQVEDSFLAASMQMLVGTVLLSGAGVLTGELAEAAQAPVSFPLVGGWLYLTLAGSLGAYSAYIFLLKVSTPARVSTYAYVNPALAVFVGWAFGSEVVTLRILVAAALLLGGVALITARKKRY